MCVRERDWKELGRCSFDDDNARKREGSEREQASEKNLNLFFFFFFFFFFSLSSFFFPLSASPLHRSLEDSSLPAACRQRIVIALGRTRSQTRKQKKRPFSLPFCAPGKTHTKKKSFSLLFHSFFYSSPSKHFLSPRSTSAAPSPGG